MSILPSKGVIAKIYIKTNASMDEIGYAQSASIDWDEGLETFYQLGSRHPVTIAEGNFEVTGSLERAWIDNTLLDLLVDTSGVLTDFDLCIMKKVGSSEPKIYVYNCKASGGSLDIPQDGFLIKTVEWTGESIAIMTQT